MDKGDKAMAIIGIDLGTTNSLVSVWKDSRIQLIPNSLGEFLTPSVVSFGKDGQVYIGRIAKEMLITNPESTFAEFKRNMGTNYIYQAGGKTYTAQDLSTLLLRRLKEDAQNFLGEEVREAVISVPAYFNDEKRCATKMAGEMAGLHVERLINEPSAVAMKHHIQQDVMETFMIVDIGGGTLDVSLVEAFENMVEIQAVAGDNYLGGKDFNEAIAMDFYRKQGITENLLTSCEREIVLKEAEELKRDLSKKQEASRSFFLGGKEFSMDLNNQELIHISVDLLKRIAIPMKKVISDSGVDIEEIDKIILVGGSSKMPVISGYIRKLLDIEVEADDTPDESIAVGVGIAAAIKERQGDVKDLILADICPFSLGTELYDGSFSPIIQRNETLPCMRTSYYVTVKDNQRELTFPIYQGENLTAKDNLKLCELKITGLPRAPKGEVGARVTFLYDINGILDIQIEGDNKQTVHKLIANKKMGLSEAEIKRRVEELKKVTMHPLEKEENRLLIEKAQSLYQQANPLVRGQIAGMLHYFRDTLEHEKGRNVREAYVRFSVFLEAMENNRIEFADDDEDFWEKWEEEIMEQDMEE